jgi:hypothetical protein
MLRILRPLDHSQDTGYEFVNVNHIKDGLRTHSVYSSFPKREELREKTTVAVRQVIFSPSEE